MSNKIIDKYLSLFGKDSDNRIKFFIYTVLKIYDNRKDKPSDNTFTAINPVFNYNTYENYTNVEKKVVKYIRNNNFTVQKQIEPSNDSTHPEIAETIVNIILHVTNKIKQESNTKRLIKELNQETSNDSNVIITKALVKVFYGNDLDNPKMPEDLLDILFGKTVLDKYNKYSVNVKTTFNKATLSLLPIEFNIILKRSEQDAKFLFRSILENIDNRSFIDMAYNNLVKLVSDNVVNKANDKSKLNFDKFLYMIYFIARSVDPEMFHRKALFTYKYKDIIIQKIDDLSYLSTGGAQANYDAIKAVSSFNNPQYKYTEDYKDRLIRFNKITENLKAIDIIKAFNDAAEASIKDDQLDFNSKFPDTPTPLPSGTIVGNRTIIMNIYMTDIKKKALKAIIGGGTITDTSNNSLIYIVLYNMLQILGFSGTDAESILDSNIENLIYLIDITVILNNNSNFGKPTFDVSKLTTELQAIVKNINVIDNEKNFILQYLGQTLNYKLDSQKFSEPTFNLLTNALYLEKDAANVYQPLKLRVHQALNYYFVNEYYSVKEPSGYNLKDFVLNWFDEATTITLRDDDYGDNSFFNVDEGNNLPQQVYYRRDKKLYKKGPTGEEILVDNKFTKEELKKDMCAPAGISGNDNDLACTDYVSKCLQGKDLELCKVFLNNPHTVFIAESEVKKMPPDLIRITIDTLKLPSLTVTDPKTKMNVRKLKLFPEWIKVLENSGFDKDQCKKIEDHKTLRTYIEAIIAEANSEYSILNDEYKSTDEIKDRFKNEAFSGSRLYSFGIKRANMRGGSDIGFSIDQLENLIYDNNLQIMNSINFNLTGGSPINYDLQLNNKYTRTSSMLASNFTELLSILLKKGKHIDPKQNIQILDKLKTLETSEDLLIRTNYFIREYIKLLNTVGESEELGDVLRMENIQKFIEARNTKATNVIGKREKILSVLRSLKELV